MKSLIDRIEDVIGPMLPEGVEGVTVTVARETGCDKLIIGKARHMLQSLSQIVADIILNITESEEGITREIKWFQCDLTAYGLMKYAEMNRPPDFSCEISTEGLDIDGLFGRDDE